MNQEPDIEIRLAFFCNIKGRIEKVRVLAVSKLRYTKEESAYNLQNIGAKEAYISKGELERIVCGLRKYTEMIQ